MDVMTLIDREEFIAQRIRQAAANKFARAVNCIDMNNRRFFMQLCFARQLQHQFNHRGIKCGVAEQCVVGSNQLFIHDHGAAFYSIIGQFFQQAKGEFLPGIPTIEPIAIGGHEMRQLICAVGVVKLYRGR